MESKAKNLTIILGPTSVGKTAISIRLAHEFKGEIINCDSMQVYQGFDIGTDKIPLDEREGIPHHLLDIYSPSQQFTAADFVKQALATVAVILARNRLPIITGGTGLYLKALLSGLFPEGRKDPALRQMLEAEALESGLATLWDKLMEVDPVYANTIGPNDRVRIIRALEVYYDTKMPFSQHFAKTKSYVTGYHIIKIGLQLEREKLYQRIDKRVEKMFAQGIVAEVVQLLRQGVASTSPPFRALGYRHVLQMLNQEISQEEAVALTQRDTRRYAKRQMTWFRKMTGIHWFSPEDYEAIKKFLKNSLR